MGVALLGARITFDQIQSLGGGALVLTACAVVLTILFGIVLARSAGLPRDFGVLTGGVRRHLRRIRGARHRLGPAARARSRA